MEFLYFLEGIRNPFLDAFFSAVTLIGSETVFLVIAILFFWCADKREGYYVLFSCLFGCLASQSLKLAMRVPRPNAIDPSFTTVGNSMEDAGGYSFPSGHTQNTTSIFAALAAYRPTVLRIAVGSVLVLLVAMSRMYLGVHTPLDVSVGLLIGLVIVLLLRPVFVSAERFDKYSPIVVALAVLACVAYTVYTFSVSGDPTLDAANLRSAKESSTSLLGCGIALIPVYAVERKFISFDTSAPWYVQVIKAVAGLGILLLLKEGLKLPFALAFGDLIWLARALRYFIVVVFAGLVWPLTFRPLSRVRIPALDRIGDRVASLLK